MSLDVLKKELEAALLITDWSPSTAELKEIAIRLKAFKGIPSKANIGNIVLEVVGSYEAMALEGVDNSDLTTLLLLATKTASSDD
jgi:hypothetical protein